MCMQGGGAELFAELANGPRGVQALEAALSDPAHVLKAVRTNVTTEARVEACMRKHIESVNLRASMTQWRT